MSTEQNQPEVEIAIAPVQTPISRETAKMVYGFTMVGTIARLYLYLFGEFDKDHVEVAAEQCRESKSVMESILNKEKTPMRAYYDYLIEKEFFEDQKLSSDAMLFIDMPDALQLRIDDNWTKQVEAAVTLLSQVEPPEVTE